MEKQVHNHNFTRGKIMVNPPCKVEKSDSSISSAFPLESGYSKLHSARAAGTGESEGGFDKVDAALACKSIPDGNNNEELSDWSPRPRLLWLSSSKSSQGDVGAIVAVVAFGA